MKLIILIILSIFLKSCSATKAVMPQASESFAILKDKRDLYLELTQEERDDSGFIRGCDSLLFTGLSIVGGVKASITSAEGVDQDNDGTGQWYRTPKKDCFSSGRSGSTISRDMFIGLFYAVYHLRELGILSRWYGYGVRNSWIVGEGERTRTFITPNIRQLAAVVEKEVGGKDRIEINFPTIYSSGLVGYEAHLQVLQILLRCLIEGEISSQMKDRIIEHHNRQPHNALYSIAYHKITDGDFSSPISSLLNHPSFPDDRLPNSNDRCTEYLFQRDRGPDWSPCPDENETYSGSDLIFAVGVLEKIFEDVG